VTGAQDRPDHLAGVRALVTGGTDGLGLAMVRALASAGASVALTGRDAGRAASVAASVQVGGAGRVIGVGMDVRDGGAVGRGVEEVRAALGGIDVLVNNAGVGMRTVNPYFMDRPQRFTDVDPDRFRDLMETNVTGYFLVARAVVPAMVDAGAGRVVNVSINEATMRRQGFIPYGPSRAASEAMSAVMAADLEGTGVTVNVLLPGGATATGMIPAGVPAEARARLLDPAVMGPAICWLASPAAAGVTGERIVATEFARGVPPGDPGTGRSSG
jgi:NAD(P)-dependent dehydrogenase (short-subunit alcohol dehydrogenase family)